MPSYLQGEANQNQELAQPQINIGQITNYPYKNVNHFNNYFTSIA